MQFGKVSILGVHMSCDLFEIDTLVNDLPFGEAQLSLQWGRESLLEIEIENHVFGRRFALCSEGHIDRGCYCLDNNFIGHN